MKRFQYLLPLITLLLCTFFALAHNAPSGARHKPDTSPSTLDSVPVFANAGVDTVLFKNQTRPDSILLNGSNSTPDQVYRWEQISGPTTPQIQLPDSATTWITGAMEGTYQFKLTINDTLSDTVTAVVRNWQKQGIYPCRAGYDTITKTGGQKILLEPNFKGTYIKPDGTTGNWNQWNFITDVRTYIQKTKKLTLSGGDTLLMEGADSTVWVELGGFGGDQGCPVYVMPKTKPVRIRGTKAFFRIATRDSNVAQYVVVDGTALRGAGYPYGFLFDNSGIGYSSEGGFTGGWVANFTLKGLHSVKTNALKIKQDPDKNPFSRYDKWIQRNILITDNWIDSSSVEGLYIGSSASDGGQTVYGWPIRMQNISITNNIITNCKWDGIQLANAREGALIRNNLVYKVGTANQPSQRAGILLGGNTNGTVEGNLVVNSRGNGVQVFGYGPVAVFNNAIDSIYGGTGDQDGMYQSFIAFESEPNNTPLSVYNYSNLISRVERDMIRVANNNGRMLPGSTHHNTFINATATDPNSLITTNVKGDVLDQNTIVPVFPYTVNTVTLTDTGVAFTVTQGDTSRTFGAVKPALDWLFGRLKSVSAANTPPVVQAGADQEITLPMDSVLLNGSASDADGGSIIQYQWKTLSGPSDSVFTAPDKAQTGATGLKEGTYQFELAATDNGKLTGKDTVQVSVLPPPNIPPVADAGADQLITAPANSVTLNGAATDADGTVASVQWAQVSGPAAAQIQDPKVVQTNISGLQTGLYAFELRVTDNRDGSTADTVQVTVNAPPVVDAGTDKSITLPMASVTLQGSATDADGTITAVQWTKAAGPASYTFQDSLSTFTSVSGLAEGIYVFNLRATDDQGGTALDSVHITVLPAPNVLPTANAGNDQTITLPTNTVTLTGSGTDSDGSIATYKWTKFSGPAQGSISKPDSSTTAVTGLVAGTYVFRLTVTDNRNGTASDEVTVTVNNATVVSTTKTINVNIYGTSNPYANTAWNNWSLKTTSVSNASSAAFKYADGTSSTVSATLSSSTAISDNGATYGSGMAPAQVLRYTSYYTNNRTLTLKGLSPSKKYSIELYASRNTSGSSTIFTVNGASQTISTYKNLTAKAVFSNLTCSASGQLVINLSKKGSFNCINGFVITEITNSTTNTMNTAPALDVVAEQPEIETETGLALYPNPATNHITLNVINDRQGTMQVSFLSVSGHVLKVVPLVKTERQSLYALSVEELPAGVYLLQVQMDGWRRTLKFLKQ